MSDLSPVWTRRLHFSHRLNRRLILQGTLGLAGVALVGCSTGGQQSGQSDSDALIAWPAEDRWPELFAKAPKSVQDTYRFAVANEHLLKWMPCFCGCVDYGHTSNFSCYVQEVRADGSVLLDSMSFG